MGGLFYVQDGTELIWKSGHPRDRRWMGVCYQGDPASTWRLSIEKTTSSVFNVKLAIGKKETKLSQNLLHFTEEWLKLIGQAGISKPVSSVESIKLWSNFTICITILVVYVLSATNFIFIQRRLILTWRIWSKIFKILNDINGRQLWLRGD